MNIDNEKFPKQEAPEKNTDHAFVQVGKDGHAVIPETANADQEDRSSSHEENETNSKR